MKKCIILSLLAIFTLAVMAPDADARRFGGGSSFGKQRMQQTAPKQLSPQKAAPGNQAGNTSQRGSARTGMMGMLGGLALGGLLGAMFFGGAFEGIKMFDILIIGGLIFLVIWFLRRKAQPQAMAYGQQASATSSQAYDFNAQPSSSVNMLRPDINETHFLKAARDIFVRMQAAWDAHDLEDIRRFSTPEVAEKIAADMQSGERNRTEVTTLQAKLTDSWIESDLEWAAVDFNALLREQSLGSNEAVSDEITHEISETWIFRHDPSKNDPTWFLAGIQQHDGIHARNP
ncbi:MAG: Tim44 domain-containing protein [Zetaproteobacteria bacterium CG12_big_fil_rev_8_21_14_0_65_55_1124]|nr:MAG: preprotein translocase subunit Tim44 [Zetaproteobacteria bacterium CG1_02_55_237]PIS19059.1 MAG: Tim44 domain-containing protein [Zetaproteobacteria bacterium CG08_land_8_20_14_0_20_55_17]PIW41839.1 MAG: Tim44 domain-containing protein [Zetaproteobacteria bacterium CG12_big_fil_rev_8_21_14_0_65_55_1124]PIY54076.1 MAG: Tim44 domain-containing protein [Zetaproteobacteria bacterium CG_4_10_14_0_8_um_filter_55_43]PIZ40251.1 MAG: Tim44 domain-containing protein [Zetaproteobacteria bacterium 